MCKFRLGYLFSLPDLKHQTYLEEFFEDLVTTKLSRFDSYFLLAAISCQFEGARGIMYGPSKTDFQASVCGITKKGGYLETIEEKGGDVVTTKMVCFCSECCK